MASVDMWIAERSGGTITARVYLKVLEVLGVLEVLRVQGSQGSVNLVNQSLDMAVTAVLSKDYAQSVGGTGVGGYLTTALANSKGELVMPIVIEWTFKDGTKEIERIPAEIWRNKVDLPAFG